METAVELAEEGGFEAVRLRDVASHAGVALGTLYRRFRSKEDLLIAALELETHDLERRVRQRPPRGENAQERVGLFFATATRGLVRRPNLARALLKAAACGEPDLAKRVAAFHERMERMVVAALEGGKELVAEEDADMREDSLRQDAVVASAETSAPGSDAPDGLRLLAHALTLMWFALLVGWSGGLQSQTVVIEQMNSCVELMVLGAEAKREA